MSRVVVAGGLLAALAGLASCVELAPADEGGGAGGAGGGDPCAGGACCGNGVVDPGEACDPAAGGAPCDDGCRPLPCGNGVVEPELGEQCDDGDAEDGDGCSSTCQDGCIAFPTLRAGWDHVAGVLPDGKVYTWGATGYGILGREFPAGATFDFVPDAVERLPAIADLQVVSGGTLAEDVEGARWVWGRNDEGQLGLPVEGASVPATVAPHLDEFPIVALGPYTSLAIDVDGALWGFGSNRFDHGELLGPGRPGGPELVRLADGPFVSARVTRATAFALHRDGTLYAWGRSHNRMLGPRWEVDARTSELVPMPLPAAVRRFEIGDETGVAELVDGRLFLWGAPVELAAAVAGTPPDEPVPVALPDGIVPVTLRVSRYAGYVIDEQGRAWSFGLSLWGALGREPSTGDGEPMVYSPPAKVELPAGATVTDVVPGYMFVFFRTSQGDLVAGDHRKGAFAHASVDPLSPVPIPEPFCLRPPLGR